MIIIIIIVFIVIIIIIDFDSVDKVYRLWFKSEWKRYYVNDVDIRYCRQLSFDFKDKSTFSPCFQQRFVAKQYWAGIDRHYL